MSVIAMKTVVEGREERLSLLFEHGTTFIRKDTLTMEYLAKIMGGWVCKYCALLPQCLMLVGRRDSIGCLAAKLLHLC